MRSRSLKPGLFKNEILGNADPLLTLLFAGLWCMADREGRLEDRPLRILAQIFPYRRQVSEKRCDRMLQQLHDWVFIQRYEVDGKRYIQVVEFSRHQSPHSQERPSIIPGLTSKPHATTPGQVAGKVEATTGEGQSHIALTPDSGLLTPDSGLLTAVTPPRRPARRDTDPEPTVAQMLQLQEAYPRGLYRGSDWGHAERLISRLIHEHGVPFLLLLENAAAYARQQQALENIGTQYILRPSNFFQIDHRGGGPWQGPFDLPPDDHAAIDEVGKRVKLS